MENQNTTRRGPKLKRTKPLVQGTYEGVEVGRGDNKKIVNPREVERLAAIGMRNSEISEWFDIDDSTLNYNFRRELQVGRTRLKESIRQAQIKLALSGNAVMLIWLGKNYLSQSDSPVDSEANQPLPWRDDE